MKSGDRHGEYRKNPWGNVELRGLIAGGTSDTVAFVLPEGYRPKDRMQFCTNRRNQRTPPFALSPMEK